MKYFLEIEVAHSSKGIIISQQKYILDLLIETSFIDCQPRRTPINVKHGLTLNENELEVNIETGWKIHLLIKYSPKDLLCC